MIRFLKSTLLFCGISLLLLLTFFWLTIEINRKLYRNITINNSITTLTIGDSHTELAINDSLMLNTLNISTPAEGYIFTYLKLQNIIKNNSQIKNVMLGVSYHNFSSYYDKYIFEEEPYALISQYISLMEYQDLIIFLRRTPSVQNLVAIFRNSFKNILKYKRGKYPYSGGFHIIENNDSLTSDRIIKRINSQYYLNDQLLKTSAINIQYLKKIVELCREKSINIIFLNTPLYSVYYSKIPSFIINEFNAKTKDLGVVVVNFDDLKLPANCFLPDGDHLNFKGALLTTEYLIEYLKNAPQSDYNNKPEKIN